MISSSSSDVLGVSLKIVELDELGTRLDVLRSEGKRIVHAHGVFDLLHVGHIRHLAEARAMGDVLVVTITEDRHVNKGPHRPAFTETLRCESLAALEVVDFVAINRAPTAVEAIAAVRPDIYVKGPDYKRASDDVTGGISIEEEAVRGVGGVLRITDDVQFSSSALINRYLPAYPEDVERYLSDLRSRYSAAEVIGYLDRLKTLRVVVVGEAILDEYVYVDQMGKSAKDPVLAMRYDRAETYAGGALAVANHLAPFCRSVELVTYLGDHDARESFVRSGLKSGVRPNFVNKRGAPTIVKRRYVEATLGQKLFEVYHIDDAPLHGDDEDAFLELLDARIAGADAVVCADFGHGLLGRRAKSALAESGKFLAVNTQINAANIRFHAISSYPRADYVCINEGELRLDARDRTAPLTALVDGLASKLACERFLVTRGSIGVEYWDRGERHASPSFATQVVDRTGAGDAVLAITSACVAAGIPPDIVAFVANVIGAQKVRIVGNAGSIERVPTVKFIQTLLKN